MCLLTVNHEKGRKGISLTIGSSPSRSQVTAESKEMETPVKPVDSAPYCVGNVCGSADWGCLMQGGKILL